jgi:hypothetical protein
MRAGVDGTGVSSVSELVRQVGPRTPDELAPGRVGTSRWARLRTDSRSGSAGRRSVLGSMRSTSGCCGARRRPLMSAAGSAHQERRCTDFHSRYALRPSGPSSRPSPLARWARTAGAQIAGLTIVGEGDTGEAGESSVQVLVVQHDGRGLAAQLQRYRTQEMTADPGDLAARGSGTGEGDLVDIRMRDQCLPVSSPLGTMFSTPGGRPARRSPRGRRRPGRSPERA